MNLKQGFRRIAKVIAFLMLLIFIINANPSIEYVDDWYKYNPFENNSALKEKVIKRTMQAYPQYKNTDHDKLATSFVNSFKHYKEEESFKFNNYWQGKNCPDLYLPTRIEKFVCTFNINGFPELYDIPQKPIFRVFNGSGDLIITLPLFILLAIIIPFATFYAYIGLEKVFLWIKDGFTKD